MDRQLKQRVVGAAVLVALGVIFIPLFLDDGALDTHVPDVGAIRPEPDGDFSSRVVPLDEAEIEAFDRRARSQLEADARSGRDPSQPVIPAAIAELPLTTSGNGQTRPSGADPHPMDPNTAVASTKPDPDAPFENAHAPRAGVEAWAVQLGSFANDANAKRLIEKLRASGYAAYLERSLEADTTVFKVRVGPHIQRAEAEETRQQLEQKFALKGLLLRYR